MLSHSCHDYFQLVARWRLVARATGLRLERIARVDGYPVYALRSRSLSGGGGLYLSAGIHGDEPASTEGLLEWAQGNVEVLREMPLLIFPCLNPWGLVRNCRLDAAGNDLNRMFHSDAHPTTEAVRRYGHAYRFEAALMLHEDYDARGVYLYEHGSDDPWGEHILEAVEGDISRDLRERIEGRRAVQGVVRPRFSAKRFERMGHPEAVWLFLRGCRRSLTFETPSELSLRVRVAAQVAAIKRFVELYGSRFGR